MYICQLSPSSICMSGNGPWMKLSALEAIVSRPSIQLSVEENH
jgi:hypothetical protein